MRKGFTLIEMIVTAAIFAIIGAVVYLNLYSSRRETSVSSSAEQISILLRVAQARAVSETRGAAWGVHFDNRNPIAAFYALFSVNSASATYISGASSIEGTYPISGDVGFFSSTVPSDGWKDIVFSPMNGVPTVTVSGSGSTTASTSVSIGTFSQPSFSSTIQVTAVGLVYSAVGSASSSGSSARGLYVVDQGNCRVEKFDMSGNYLSAFGSGGSGNGQFTQYWAPNGIAFDAAGNIYVANGAGFGTVDNIQKFDSNGNYLSSFGSYGIGNGQLYYPTGIALDSAGNIYVTDTGGVVARVEKFSSSGGYLSQFGSTKLESPFALALDSSQNIYVSDNYYNAVLMFNSAGIYQSKFGSPGSGNGQFNGAWGVVVR